MPVRVVFDTNVVRAGIRSQRRPEYRCLQLLTHGSVALLATPALYLEYEEVLLKEETLTATGLERNDIEALLIGLAALIEPVLVDYDWRPLLPDPDDDMIANCAANGMADCVVTNNVRHLRLISERFGIPVLRPQEFLREVEQASKEENQPWLN